MHSFLFACVHFHRLRWNAFETWHIHTCKHSRQTTQNKIPEHIFSVVHFVHSLLWATHDDTLHANELTSVVVPNIVQQEIVHSSRVLFEFGYWCLLNFLVSACWALVTFWNWLKRWKINVRRVKTSLMLTSRALIGDMSKLRRNILKSG